MKIVYINGYKETPKLSTTYQHLKENLPKDEVIPCNWHYDDGIDIEKIKHCIEEINPDIIVASSTGGLIADSFDIPKILINPVVDRKDLEKLHPDKDFSNLPEKPEHYGDIRAVIVGKNDEILNYEKTIKEFKEDRIVIVIDKHRLNNKEIILKEINNLKSFLNDLTFIEG